MLYVMLHADLQRETLGKVGPSGALSLQRLLLWLLTLGSALLTATEPFRAKCLGFSVCSTCYASRFGNLHFAPFFSCLVSSLWALYLLVLACYKSSCLKRKCFVLHVCVLILCLFGHQGQIPPQPLYPISKRLSFLLCCSYSSQCKEGDGDSDCMFLWGKQLRS